MGNYMTTHGKIHDNDMAWHGLAMAWKSHAMARRGIDPKSDSEGCQGMKNAQK